MTSRARRAGAGFTLLETLVALVLLGLLAAGLAQGVQFGFTAWNAQERSAGSGDLDAADRALRELVRHVALPEGAHEPGLLGAGHRFLCVTSLPDAVAMPGGLVDAFVGVDGAHRLMLRWTPHLHARLLAPRPLPQEAELLQGVERLDIAYWPSTGNGAWSSAWGSTDLPALLRIRLVFAPSDRRHWPDIIVAPKAERFVNEPGDG